MKQHLDRMLMIGCMAYGCVQLQPRQHAYYGYYENPYDQSSSFSKSSGSADDGAATAAAIIFIIAFIGLMAVAFYYCCKALRNRSSNTREYVGNPPYQQFSQPAYPQPPLYPTYQQQRLTQPVQVGRPAGDFPANQANPYGPSSDRERLNSPCDACNVKYKLGEEPRAMVSCQSRHIFHLSCLSSAVRYQNEFKCPKC
jgi:hypothetical protein